MSIRCKLLLAAGLILAVNLSLGLHVLRAYKGAMTESGRIHQQTAETVTQAISVQVHFKKQVQEWKNILLRGHEPNLYAKYLAQFEQERQRVEELSGRLLGRLEPGSPSWQQAQAFEQAHQRLTQTYRQALLLFDREDPLAQIRVDRQVRGMDRPLTDLIDELILAAEYYKRDQLAQMAERLEQRENELLAVVLGLLLLSLLGLLVLAERIIARPISLAIQMAQSISAGSRHTQASIQGSGEMARLHQALQTMQANLLAGEQALNREKALLEQRVKERTRELRFVNEELARAAKAKDLFLAGMSHELRTPLTTLIGLTEMLRDQLYGPLNPAQQEALKTMDESAHHLLSLINDILDLAKVESGKIELHTDHVPLQQLIESSLSLVRSSAESKGQALEVKLDPRVALIQGDIRRLKQMLLNLLGNALKFTPAQGRIGIEVLAEAERKTVLIRVWDTGIGIDPEQFDKLFEPFVQLQEVPGGHNPGTGLGLTLVNRMALLHRGSISVQSTPGQGSCFNLRLPWDPEQNDPAALGHETKQTTGLALPTSGGQGAAILLAEDNPANREMTRAYLQRQGFALTTASNGLEALSLARDTPPDLILMDVQLALIDGLEVTQKLRAMPGLAHLPIIALTAMAMPGDRERCLEAGMDDYISKPLGLQELLQLILKWLR